jgi:3-oxoadipate enol-lactonase
VPVADVNGQRLYYESHGEGEPLVIVMGLSTDHLAWAMQIPEWSKHYRVVEFDNRDVGQSSYADGPYEIADMARDTLALADELGLDTFHLLGMSMGGAIAQEAALAAPERIRTLTLVVTFAHYGRWGAERARIWSAAALRTPREEHVDNLLLLTLSQELYDEQPDFVAYVRQMTLSNPHPQAPEAFTRQLDAISRHHTLDRLGSLSMPTHVIGAEHDILVPVWKSSEIAEAIPGAKLTIVERAPHGVNVERADDFNRAVLDFLAGVEAPA